MTIAAGFVCSDGILLAAGAQETIPGYTKNSTEDKDLGRSGLGMQSLGLVILI